MRADAYFPCATQNEINEADARHIAANEPLVLVEGANMPSTPDAIKVFQQAGIAYAPGKASDAAAIKPPFKLYSQY